MDLIVALIFMVCLVWGVYDTFYNNI